MTVNDLICELKKYPYNLPILAFGPDCGGYDVILSPDVKVILYENRVFIKGLEMESFEFAGDTDAIW